MKIGIDLDGVVFDSEKEYRVYSELYDVMELKRNSIIDNKNLKFQDRYRWSKEETEKFINKYNKMITEKSNLMPGAEEVLNLLKEEGHELVIVTARGTVTQDGVEITKKVLKEKNMDIFDEYFWGIKEKGKICKQENIDLMIDDSYQNCLGVVAEGIETIYLKDAPSVEANESKNIKVLYNWGEIYRYIKEKDFK